MLNDDPLCSARPKALKRQQTLLKCHHHASGRTGKPGRLDVRPLLFLASHIGEVIEPMLESRTDETSSSRVPQEWYVCVRSLKVAIS
jgi:hypothetical protein